ncbi:MAG: hypothetical protein F4X41_05370 [Chloroflexi bacterium]|nr:hypothetical protein [Chloroflexota bacterium]
MARTDPVDGWDCDRGDIEKFVDEEFSNRSATFLDFLMQISNERRPVPVPRNVFVLRPNPRGILHNPQPETILLKVLPEPVTNLLF